MYPSSKSSAYNRSLTLPCRLCSRNECKFSSTCRGDSWQHLLRLVQTADRNMYKHKREDLDRYIRYGIIMFTFNFPILLDSYKWITGNASYSFIAQYCADYQPRDDGTPFIPYHAAVAVVSLWAVSLLLISVTITMCHLNHQWLREFVNQPQFSCKNQLAFRQIHYDSLCRWKFFNICDIIPLLLLLSVIFFTVGLIVFLWYRNHPDAYACLGISCVLFLYYTVIAMHPLYCFLKASQDGLTSELSPFRSPSSWVFFKLFMRCFNFIYCTQRKRALLKHRRALLPLHSQFRPPVRTKSVDWLEQDCSLFMQEDNPQKINAPLTNALIWIDSNPTIEKTIEVVVSVYYAINDLHFPSILSRFKESCTGQESGLAGIIATASQKYTDVNDPAVTAFVLKSWLELHVMRLPELGTQLVEPQNHCVNEISKRMPDYARLGINSISAFLIPGRHLPEEKVYSLLSSARTGLEDRIYYEGTFKLIFQVIFQFRDSASKRDVNLVFAILAECKHFVNSFRGSGLDDTQQSRQFTSELENFISDIQAIDCDFDLTSDQQTWSPRSSDIWKEIIVIANEVYLIADLSLQGFLSDMSPASLTELDDFPCDGAYPVSSEESFDSIQFKTNDTGVESATNSLTVWPTDDGSCHKFFEPEADPASLMEPDDFSYDGAYPVSPKESFDSIQFETNDAGVESATNALTVRSTVVGSCPKFSKPETASASPTEQGDFPYDDAYPVSPKESFDSIQFETNDAGIESAANALTVWNTDAGSCHNFSEPEAAPVILRFKRPDVHCVLKRTWTNFHLHTVYRSHNSTSAHTADSYTLNVV